MEKEIWKDIKGYEGFYQISSFGKIRSVGRKSTYRNRTVKGKLLKSTKNNSGYYCIVLIDKESHKKLNLIHRLVASTFIPNPLNKSCVNHIDCNKNNNKVDNLEWCSYSENMQHALKNNLYDYSYLEKPIIQIKNGVEIAKYKSITEASNIVKRDKRAIWGVLNGRRKSSAGYEWRYA